MKAILISIKPKYVADILNGKKTIEIRKTCPKCDLPIVVYIYCTKEEYLYKTNKGYFSSKNPLEVGKGTEYSFAYSDEGKVVAKFTLNKVEEIKYHIKEDKNDYEGYYIDKENYYPTTKTEICINSCLTYNELDNYLKCKNGYAWHISNLVIFDEPKELSEFYKVGYLEERYAVESHLADIEGCDGGVNESYVDKLYEELDQEFQLKKAPQSWCYVEAIE